MRSRAWGIILSVVALFILFPTKGNAQMDRAYTVKEIDALREIVEHKYLCGRYKNNYVFDENTHTYIGSLEFGRSYNEVEKSKVVEEQLCTWMLAGKTAQDLIDSEK